LIFSLRRAPDFIGFENVVRCEAGDAAVPVRFLAR